MMRGNMKETIVDMLTIFGIIVTLYVGLIFLSSII